MIFLPLPRTSDEIKYIHLRERLRAKKQAYIEGIKKTGTVSGAMQYAGIKSRGTLGNYRENDKNFEIDEIKAFEEFEFLAEDMAIAGLLDYIKDKDLQAIKYYLDRRSLKFRPRGEIESNVKGRIENVQVEIIRNNHDLKFIKIEGDQSIRR